MKSFTTKACKLGVALCAAALTTYAGTRSAHAFDFDNGNAPIEIVIPTVVPTIFASVSGPGDASLILRWTSEFTVSWFDAIAPYEQKQVGVYSSLGRRPAGESTTNANKNVAILYASYHVMNSLFPAQKSAWQSMLSGVGLDPNNTSTDLSTPIGIGNVAGANVVAFREHDGMNQLGDENGRKYHRHAYEDYLGYEPVNTAYDLFNPSRWQPNFATNESGIFKIQQFVTPQWSVTAPYAVKSYDNFVAPPPTASILPGCDKHAHGLDGDDDAHRCGKKSGKAYQAYKAQADQVLATQANLTDLQKVTAEFFNDKIRSLGFSDVFIWQSRGLSLSQFVQYDFLENIAAFDGGIAVWREKLHYDAVRPFSAIHWIYGDNPVSAWGGPGKGTVNDMPGREWTSYLSTADHAEYPSGSACFCAAHAQAARRFLGSESFGWNIPVPAGSSVIEPGTTPAADVVMSFPTWTDFETICGQSRNWGGVHFQAAIQAGHDLCKPIGDIAYDFVENHINGTP